jgi:hypothetical protein
MPVRLNERVHQRLNRALLVTHFVDLLAGALPYLAGHLLRGVGHLIGATISGRFESDRVGRSREAP